MATSDRRPDPAKGVFETLLVVGGEPMELGGHLARLGRSLAEIYGSSFPPGRASWFAPPPPGSSSGACGSPRSRRRSGRHRPRGPRRSTRRSCSRRAGAALRRSTAPGGHGSHKWVDRAGWTTPTPAPGQLICDGEELLEAGWANLFAVREETLWTPAADGRILAGMARAAVLEIAGAEGIETREQPLTADDLLAADEIFLTNSIRGIEPATALDGTPLPGSGPISRRLADALRRRWSCGARLPQAAQPPRKPISSLAKAAKPILKPTARACSRSCCSSP